MPLFCGTDPGRADDVLTDQSGESSAKRRGAAKVHPTYFKFAMGAVFAATTCLTLSGPSGATLPNTRVLEAGAYATQVVISHTATSARGADEVVVDDSGDLIPDGYWMRLDQHLADMPAPPDPAEGPDPDPLI